MSLRRIGGVQTNLSILYQDTTVNVGIQRQAPMPLPAVKYMFVVFEVLIAVVKKSTILVITPCTPLSVNRRFGETSLPFSGSTK
jgi:hypothetical protein